MTLNVCQEISRTIGSLFTCERVNEFIRISTTFSLPDGTLVDLFFKEKENLYILTDLGETLGWLYLQTDSYGISRDQELAIKRIAVQNKAIFQDGMLVIKFEEISKLSENIFGLLQIIIRVTDTNPKLKKKNFSPITEDVEVFLKKEHLYFQKDIKIIGKSGSKRQINFCVYYSNNEILINVLSTYLRRTASSKVDKVFTTWSEISYLDKSRHKFISLIDDRVNVWNKNDTVLLSQVSQVINWSEKTNFKALLNSY